jgi:uncharacterized protein
MNEARFRFYAELNDFLPLAKRQVEFAQRFEGRPAVKDLIEAIGAPHTEVDLILANGRSVDFTYQVQDGDRISVYPVFEALDIGPVLRVRPEPLREMRFVCDTHLGRLAAYLRMLGFDTWYRNDSGDEELAALASWRAAGKWDDGEGDCPGVPSQGRRILLTRDRGLLKRSEVTHGYCVRETNPRLQLREVVRRFDLARAAAPLRRCLKCNGLLEPTSKEAVSERLLPQTRETFDMFWACGTCGQVYWQGSHYDRMRHLIDWALGDQRTGWDAE